MGAHSQPERTYFLVAEEVLRTIYGDDLKGCTVSLDEIAIVLQDTLRPKQARTRELLELYEKVVEAIQLLSTPPDAGKITDPNTLRSLLSDRLDAIHSLTTKTMQTTTLAKGDPE